MTKTHHASRRAAVVFIVAAATATARLGAGPQDGQSNAEPDQYLVGVPWSGEAGISQTVTEIMAREAAQANRAQTPREANRVRRINRPRADAPDAPAAWQWPLAAPDVAAPTVGFAGPLAAFNISTNFRGPRFAESGFIPPDSNGAVGPTQVLVTANGRFKLYNKTGTLLGLDVSDQAFWGPVLTPGSTFVSDPHVRYDRLSSRWFISEIDIPEPCECSNRILIAVSSGPTITNSSSFTLFQFQHDLVGPTPNPDTGGFADYDTLGVDANALYIGVNEFSASGFFLNTTGYVVRKSSLLSGGPPVVTAFRQLLDPGTFVGPYTPQGVDNDDPAATEGYFVGVDGAFFSRLAVRRVTTPGATPAISGTMLVTVPTTRNPIPQLAQGSVRPLDAIDDRLYAAMIKKNRLTGVSSLWTAHNIGVNASGVAGVTAADRNAGRWYQLGNLTTSPTLTQSGTVFDSSASNQAGFWINTIAANGQGHAGIAQSWAGPTIPASMAVFSRLASDPAGSMSNGLGLLGIAGYNVQTGGTAPQRWGDFSQVVVDPNDDMTMWTFQEYADAANSWAVRAIKLMAPPPAMPTSASVPVVNRGLTTATIMIFGVSSAGSGFFDPGSGFANRLTASVSGGVTVNSATFIDAVRVTLDISTVGASAGLKDVTITNPDGQSLTGTGVFRVVSQRGDLNLDGMGDLLWRNKSTGQNIGYLMDGTTVASSGFLSTIADTNWGIRGMGDFDADGKGDVLWRNRVTGQNIGWLMNGLTVSTSAFMPTIADTNWEIKGVGDFDADGKADVLWRNKATGQNIGWLMNGLTVSSSAFLPTIADTNWEIVGAGDFDGDGKADVILRNKSTGQNIGWLMNGLTVSFSAFLPTIADTNWEIKAVGDVDGSGKADVILRNKSTGQNIGWLMNGLTVATSAFLPTIADTNWEIKSIGDFDGNGKADLAWRNKVTGQNIAWLMNGLTVASSAFLPTIADTNWEIVGP